MKTENQTIESSEAKRITFPSANEYPQKDIDRVMGILDELDPFELVDGIIEAMGVLARFEDKEPSGGGLMVAYYVLELHLKAYMGLIKSRINNE